MTSKIDIILKSKFQNFKNGESQKRPNLRWKFSMVPGVGFHFSIVHLVEDIELYKMRYAKVKSDVGNHTKFSQQKMAKIH